MSSRPRIPPGFRFSPTDDELLQYLECKVMGKPLPYDNIIVDVNDMYKPENHPESLIQRYGDDENLVYVFTRLKKVSDNGKNFDRKVGDYTWKANNKGTPVGDKKRCFGRATTFCFVDKSDVKIGFIMKQFTLDKSILAKARDELKDYVLCRIYKKSKLEKANPMNFNPQEDQEAELVPNSNHYFQVKNETMNVIPSLISCQTALHPQPPVDEDLHGALIPYGDQIQKESSSIPASNVPQPNEITFHNAQQQEQQEVALIEFHQDPNLSTIQASNVSASREKQDQIAVTSTSNRAQMGNPNAVIYPSSSRATLRGLDEQQPIVMMEIDNPNRIARVRPVRMVRGSRAPAPVRATTNIEQMRANNKTDHREFRRDLYRKLNSMKWQSDQDGELMVDNRWGQEILGEYIIPH